MFPLRKSISHGAVTSLSVVRVTREVTTGMDVECNDEGKKIERQPFIKRFVSSGNSTSQGFSQGHLPGARKPVLVPSWRRDFNIA